MEVQRCGVGQEVTNRKRWWRCKPGTVMGEENKVTMEVWSRRVQHCRVREKSESVKMWLRTRKRHDA